MNIIKLSEFIKLAKHLDSVGKFKEADNLLIKISNYYPEQSQTKTKDISYFVAGLESNDNEPVVTQHQRMCIEVSRNF